MKIYFTLLPVIISKQVELNDIINTAMDELALLRICEKPNKLPETAVMCYIKGHNTKSDVGGLRRRKRFEWDFSIVDILKETPPSCPLPCAKQKNEITAKSLGFKLFGPTVINGEKQPKWIPYRIGKTELSPNDSIDIGDCHGNCIESTKQDHYWKLRQQVHMGCTAKRTSDLLVRNLRTGDIGILRDAIIDHCQCAAFYQC